MRYLICVISLLFVFASSTKFPSTASSDASTGTVAWSNYNNAKASDNSYATVVLGDGEQSQYLLLTGYGFSIPSGATIDGVEVNVEGKASNGFGSLASCVLSPDMGTSGDDWANTSNEIPNGVSDATVIMGGTTYTFGLSLLRLDVVNPEFGIAISYIGTDASTTYYIDAVSMTVYYTTVSGTKRRVIGFGNGITKDELVYCNK